MNLWVPTTPKTAARGDGIELQEPSPALLQDTLERWNSNRRLV